MKDFQKIKIGFFGTPDFSLEFLKNLFINKFDLNFVVSQPPSKSGRGKILKKSSVHLWAEKNKIKVFTPHNPNSKEFIDLICSRKTDFLVVVAYGNLIPKKILDSPKFLSINVHASLLPRWRGAAPIQRAILSGDKRTGVSIMKVVEELDAGPIIVMKSFVIDDEDTSGTIYKKILSYGKDLLIEALNKISNNDFKLINQDISKVTYAAKVRKTESKIEWTNNAKNIYFQVKAFNPYPGAWTILNGEKRIKILKSEPIMETSELENLKLEIGQSTPKLEVKCGLGFLRIHLLQKEGGKPITSNQFLNGMKISKILFK